MKTESVILKNIKFPLYRIGTLVIGSGCAGYNAADWLYDLGKRDIALITEGVNMGTSRNTGSDKQTYYKLSLGSDGVDSVAEMAKTLFEGRGVNGDTAMIEAACSVRSFIKLANLGVPFPTNRYGEYVGYKTDHDPHKRATSAGPLTSKYMTECLERSVLSKGIKIFDGVAAVKLLVKNGAVYGVVAIDSSRTSDESRGITLYHVKNVIMATGGPAGLYASSVYPESQTGMTGMALEAGVKAANLHQWQYGLASTKFRWNVSGTYQQVLPRYISVDAKGNEFEFLSDHFSSAEEALHLTFLKGYQWPFDSAKISGSSKIDLLVYDEIYHKDRRVFLDFTREPKGLEKGFSCLSKEAFSYLRKSEALISTPIARLAKMNPQAIALYKNHGIDLYSEPLQIDVCAQHCNGGIAVDENYESSIKGLYAAGEAAGTFGAYRPGGSALNSTQVGSMRAAEHIAYSAVSPFWDKAIFAGESANLVLALHHAISSAFGDKSNLIKQRVCHQQEMSKYCGFIRNKAKLEEMLLQTRRALEGFWANAKIKHDAEIPHLLKNRDLLLVKYAMLSAVKAAAEQEGSTGGALVIGAECGNRRERKNALLETEYKNGEFHSKYCPVRPLKPEDDWFETVWRDYCIRTGKGGDAL